MTLPKFEEWKAPWEVKGEDLDENTVRRLVYNLKVAEEDLEEKVKTVTAAKAESDAAVETFKKAQEEAAREGESEAEKAKRLAETSAAQAAKDLAEAKRENDLLKIRIEVPEIEEKDLDRLRGDDFDALLADAKEFAERLAPKVEEDPDGEQDPEDDGDATLNRNPRLRNSLDPKLPSGNEETVQQRLDKRAASQLPW